MPLPTLTEEQRKEALAKAAEARKRRAELKGQLKAEKMTLRDVLAQQGTPPKDLSTSVTVTFVPGTGITTSKIDVEGQVPGIDEAAFGGAADEAKDGCPVSLALKGNVEVSVAARLIG